MRASADATSQSFFGWLDYDERDAQRMREVFAAFDDKDTIDSLALKAADTSRLFFGQPRRKELIGRLAGRIPDDERAVIIDCLKVDLTPPEISA